MGRVMCDIAVRTQSAHSQRLIPNVRLRRWRKISRQSLLHPISTLKCGEDEAA